jgi:hypothetical protein
VESTSQNGQARERHREDPLPGVERPAGDLHRLAVPRGVGERRDEHGQDACQQRVRPDRGDMLRLGERDAADDHGRAGERAPRDDRAVVAV